MHMQLQVPGHHAAPHGSVYQLETAKYTSLVVAAIMAACLGLDSGLYMG